ncbi:ATP-binding cassette domain-containing protein [bacterium AH-315-F03]|nr:ATP-binding cassette domain-containing protein [bacterium AH-315-F03]
MAEEYLRLENITKTYSGKEAVKSLSLSVPRGAIYGIIGPNGAGKTTTIRMIMNIIAPDSGRRLINGAEPTDEFTDCVGYLPEERGLHKKMKVLEIIRFMARLKNYKSSDWDKESRNWLEIMGLSEIADKKVEELSKGMQQKLQFITTVFHKPEFIILDELFSGLDPLNMELVKNQLFKLRDEGATVLFSTHVMEQAEKMCDHICMIKDGVKILDGPIAEVKARFGKDTVHISHNGDSSVIRNHPTVKELIEFPNYFEAKLHPDADHMDLLRDLVNKMTLYRFEIVEPSLYNIFLTSVGIDASMYEQTQFGATDSDRNTDKQSESNNVK